MLKQQAIMKIPKHLQIPFWKRLMLVTAVFLSSGPLALMTSTQVAYASSASPLQYTTHSIQTLRNNVLLNKSNKLYSAGKNSLPGATPTKSLPSATPTNGLPGTPPTIIHDAGYSGCYGGQGGSGGVSYASSTGGGGGPGGDCILYSNKGETGGSSGSGSSGGNIYYYGH